MSEHPVGACFADIADMGEEWTFCPFCGGRLHYDGAPQAEQREREANDLVDMDDVLNGRHG